jgi:hypothetical protein
MRMKGKHRQTYRDNGHQEGLRADGGGRQRPRVGILRKNVSNVRHDMSSEETFLLQSRDKEGKCETGKS